MSTTSSSVYPFLRNLSGPRQPCQHSGHTNHSSDRCWAKFRRPAWAQTATSTSGSLGTASTTSILSPQSMSSSLVTLSAEEYAAFRLSQTQQSSAMASHVNPTTEGNTAFVASSSPSWILDSGASSHMSGTRSLFYQFVPISPITSVSISNGNTCPVLGEGLYPYHQLFLLIILCP